MRVVSTQVQGFTEVVGREEELAGLREFFLGRVRRPFPVLRVLTGLGGIGKTSLARAYCARYQQHYGLVWWVRAGDADAVATEFRGLLEILVPQDANRVLLEILAPQDANRVTDPIQAVQAVLANRDQPWLLVVDNIAGPEDLRGLLPASGAGDVIVTSRASGWPDQRAVLPVSLLDDESAVQLLTSVSGDPDRAAAAAVAQKLGNLPLALAQAASYVAQADLDMAGYLVLYRRHRPEMHREGHAPDYDEQVATTWQLAFDRLTSPARALLNLLCWYAPDAIPLDRLFTDHAVDLDLSSTVASEVQPLLADELCRYRAIADLAAYSLLTRAGVRGSVNVHRLVQAVTIDSLKAHGADESWVSAAAALLRTACPDPPANATTLKSWGSLQTHVRALGAHLDPIQPISLSLRGCLAEWTELAGDARGAAQQYAPLVEDTQRVRGVTHRDSLIARRHLARCLGDSGEVTRARDMLGVLVQDTEQALGPLDEETLTVRGELARYTAECGSTTVALRLAQDLLQDMQPALGPDHPETLRTRSDLARLTGETGDAAKAVELYTALVEDRLRIFGADHPGTLIDRGSFAMWTAETGDPARALQLGKTLLNDQLRVLGAEHPDTLRTRYLVAYYTGEAGDPGAALSLYRELLPDQVRVLGAEHPNTVLTRYRLAGALREQGDLEQAEAEYRMVLTAETNRLGADHPDTMITRQKIADVLQQRGDLNAAIIEYRELLADQMRVLGAEHPDTLTTQQRLSTLKTSQPPP